MAQETMTIFPLSTLPGVKRDGTVLDGQYYTDARWCRFRGNRPRKIGGYRLISDELFGPIQTIFVSPRDGQVFVYTGSQAGVQQTILSPNGFGGFTNDRTPAGYTANDANLWTFDDMFDSSGGGTPVLIAHYAPNLDDIDNETGGAIYLGDITAATQLTLATSAPAVCGGIVVLHPFLFAFCKNGYVQWSAPNNPNSWPAANYAYISGSKVVAGRPTRSGGQSPGGLFWTLDSVIRTSFVGSTSGDFRFDTITDESSIMSSSSIIEMDGIFYWVGIDKFLTYNGVVKEIPNDMNKQFFFDNVNYSFRQKVWATKVSKFGEIWWFFPKGESTVCNHAIVYQPATGTWYDTPIDRSAGFYSQVFRYPIWADPTPTTATSGDYRIWMHEFGYDRVEGNQVYAIQSYFESADITWAANGPAPEGWSGIERNVELSRIEPDFVQQENMSVYVTGEAFARGEPTTTTYTFGPATTKIDMREQRRQMRLRYESNVAGGFYEMGQPLHHFKMGDKRP